MELQTFTTSDYGVDLYMYFPVLYLADGNVDGLVLELFGLRVQLSGVQTSTLHRYIVDSR